MPAMEKPQGGGDTRQTTSHTDGHLAVQGMTLLQRNMCDCVLVLRIPV